MSIAELAAIEAMWVCCDSLGLELKSIAGPAASTLIEPEIVRSMKSIQDGTRASCVTSKYGAIGLRAVLAICFEMRGGFLGVAQPQQSLFKYQLLTMPTSWLVAHVCCDLFQWTQEAVDF